MKVLSVNSISPKPHFNAILKNGKDSYTSLQEQVIENIKKEMKTPKADLNNMTTEEFYSQNGNFDFLLLPQNEDNSRVDLYITRMHIGNKNCSRGVFYKRYIGNYGLYDDLNNVCTDIERAKQEDEKYFNRTMTITKYVYIAIAAVMLGFMAADMIPQIIKNKGNIIKNIDKLMKKTDATIKNTVSYLNVIKK